MDLIKQAREMGKAIQASEEYAKLKKAQEANDNDEELQDLIGKFNLKRMELNNLLAKDEKDEEKLGKMNQELRDLYQNVMGNVHMAEYNEAKNAMDMLMNQVNAILVLSVNGEDPETCDPAPSCSGSCSTCGGCH
ncbi:MAG: YlbF family regulator [Oscillospiraceae bacterium]|nr:YlbF family regulator [Oscillospiraceae bacterium]